MVCGNGEVTIDMDGLDAVSLLRLFWRPNEECRREHDVLTRGILRRVVVGVSCGRVEGIQLFQAVRDLGSPCAAGKTTQKRDNQVDVSFYIKIIIVAINSGDCYLCPCKGT